MSWFNSVIQGEAPGVTLTLIVVVLAIALVLLFWIFRKIAGANNVKAGRSRRPRLSVTDAAVVDDKRRLVLVRRDNIEHLVMIGGPTDIVIEQGIAVLAASRAGHVAHEPDLGAEPVEPAADETPSLEAETADVSTPEEPVRAAPAFERPIREPARDQATQHAPERAAQARPALERPEPAKSIGERPVLMRPPLTPPAPPSLAERATERPAARAEPQVAHASQASQEETESEDFLDEQFTSDLEAAFNEDQSSSATPAVAAESRYGASRRSASSDIAPPESPARKRSENMEDEMQRLLDELSGSKPN